MSGERAPLSLFEGGAAIADMSWLDAVRARAWLSVLAFVSLFLVLAWIALSRGGLDWTGKPLGTDFLSFWSAARVLMEGGTAADVYGQTRHAAEQTAAFGGADVGYTPFPYPPIFLLICAPLGLLPYLPALAAWVAATGYAYVRALQGWLGARSVPILAVIALPAAVLNLANGQTAFLTTALFGAGGLLLGRRDFLAGVCLGALAFKPHLGVLIPVALMASGNWRAFLGATLSCVGLAAASVLAFGVDVWLAYPQTLSMMKAVVESGALDAGKVQTVFAALRVWEVPLSAAYAAQALVALVVAATVGWLGWTRPRSAALGPALVAGTLLMSPYMLDYDLVLCAIPLAWLLSQGIATGFRRWEKAVMLTAYVLPLVARLLASQAHLPLAPLVLMALFALVVRRAADPQPVADSRRADHSMLSAA